MEVETYYKTLFNVANDAILISNDLAYVECNEKAVEMFGLPREELLKKTILDCSPELQPDGSRSRDRLADNPPGFAQRQAERLPLVLYPGRRRRVSGLGGPDQLHG